MIGNLIVIIVVSFILFLAIKPIVKLNKEKVSRYFDYIIEKYIVLIKK